MVRILSQNDYRFVVQNRLFAIVVQFKIVYSICLLILFQSHNPVFRVAQLILKINNWSPKGTERHTFRCEIHFKLNRTVRIWYF